MPTQAPKSDFKLEIMWYCLNLSSPSKEPLLKFVWDLYMCVYVGNRADTSSGEVNSKWIFISYWDIEIVISNAYFLILIDIWLIDAYLVLKYELI